MSDSIYNENSIWIILQIIYVREFEKNSYFRFFPPICEFENQIITTFLYFFKIKQ